jgi:shikimate dehydrogenase
MVYEWRDAPVGDFAVIGNPIAHSKSPKMHQKAYESLGISSSYFAIRAEADEFFIALNHLKAIQYKGVNVTIPHKESAFRWCRSTNEIAKQLKVVNTINLQSGHGINTDSPGFGHTLNQLPLSGKNAVILGAGGSTRAVIAELIDRGWEIKLWNRTYNRALELATEFALAPTKTLSISNADLVVNTTSASLTGESLPINWSEAKPECVAYDLAYGDGETVFVQSAKLHHLHAVDGRELLISQGALAFEFWWNIPAPIEAMRSAIR